MKKILLLGFLYIFTLCAFGQEHLLFKGIPIEGSISSFCQKLKAKGLTPMVTENNVRLFSGDFTGRNATIGVVADQSGQNVFSVTVLFPQSGEWYSLVDTYNHYKELYTEKYGKPTMNEEYNHSRDNSNILRMREVYNGTVVYMSVFSAPGGEIAIYIDKAEGAGYQGQVVIKYEDKQNIHVKRQADLDEI